MSCLRIPSASRIGPGVSAARGGRGIDFVYGVTKAACLHVKEDFFREWRGGERCERHW